MALQALLLKDAAKFPRGPHWPSLKALQDHLGPRPEKAYLAKRDTRTAHGPGNTYWKGTPDSTREQDRALRRSQKAAKPLPPYPTSRRALAALLRPPQAPSQAPSQRTRTQQEQDQQVKLLIEVLND